ncbi:hypothetical protein BV22DRAFT_1176335 [Leucogyrophana mollusca]|uniref:Uncharacterized protein n=1 Tax=Leucogyrophana mollusca TaxID=85980 RepID=A0ACB8B8Q9_9AGAM|nr:hypothetical protein BV22DRAFT_1176335 [Leucogyrophana mollusca]
MASKAANIPSTSFLSSSSSHLPPTVSVSDELLSSILPLPDNPCIVCATYIAAPDVIQVYEPLEVGRRHLVERNKSLSFSESLLPSVNLHRDASALHVFSVTSRDHMDTCKSSYRSLSLDGLILSELLSFQPQDLYPCSSHCADQRSPCASCLQLPSVPFASGSNFGSASLLPRKPLRKVYAHFLDAARSRLIDDIVEASRDKSRRTSARRLRNGFLLGSPRTAFEWGTDWQHNAQLRLLHLTPSRLEIHFVIRGTHYVPLYPSLPLPTGTPITLLPYAIPAFFLASYIGPASRLTAQFEQSLSGLGAGDWKFPPPAFPSSMSKQKNHRADSSVSKDAIYVIAWLAVQNKQGEDKGMPVIWPSRLCVSFLPSSPSAHARRVLSYIPELPSQLQPSPPPPPPPAISVETSSPVDQDQTPISPPHSIPMTRPITRRTRSSPASESIRAFRSLTLARSVNIEQVATEIGSYVESVAREREKERERIRRERETAHVSASPRGIVTPPAGAGPTPGSSSTPTVSVEIPSALPVPPANSPVPPDTTSAAQASHAISHTFYPSPPVTNGPQSVTTEPQALYITGTPDPLAAAPPASVGGLSQSDSVSGLSAYDPFASMDSSWAQPANDFINMGITYEMGFDMNMDTIPTGSGGGNGNADRLGMDFEDGFTFTDDDFSFFDRPSAPSRPTAAAPMPLEDPAGLTPAAGPAPMGLSPSLFADASHFSSSGPIVTSAHQYSSPWTTTGTAEGFTPRFVDHHMHDLITPAPDLMPSSPGMTTASHSAPATPQVHIFGHEHHRTPSAPHNFFDPIPFAPSHRIADSKYAMGKFALPSPPDEEDRTEPIPSLSSPIRISSWKLRYNAVTDPRIGVVRKLIGVKRKSFDQGSREHRNTPIWIQEHEDWASTTVIEDAEDVKSDVASEDDDIDDDVPPIASRAASTPPPSYLPLGPTLLYMHFRHPHLLPLSGPLKPPGAAVAPMGIPTTVPAFAPTPVSPAAALGTASEKSKSLEGAGYMVAREAVENTVWANAWRSNNIFLIPEKPASNIWHADISSLSEVIANISALGAPPSLKTFFDLGTVSLSQDSSLQLLEPPLLSVGKADSIIQVLPSAIRFREKLGLGPRGGKKDVCAFVFFEDEGPEKQQQAETWLNSISAMYDAKHLGSHAAGSSSLCPKDGIFPLHLESLRKSLVSLIATLPASHGSLVFYIVTPDSAMSLSSPLLRQVFTAVKNAQKTYSEARILFQFVPEYFMKSTNNSNIQDADMEALCFSVFRRVLLPVDRYMSRRLFDHGERSRSYFQEPPIIIARPLINRVQFTRQSPAETWDVIDRHTLLHVGYRISGCGKWLFAACVDQRGEAYDLGVWLTQEDSEAAAVGQVWNFAQQFARKASVEWHIVFAKLGLMSASELDAWANHLSTAASSPCDLPPFQATVLCVDRDMSWTTVQQVGSLSHQSSKRSPSKDLPKPVYLDTASATYALYPSTRIPVPTPPSSTQNGIDASFVPDCEDVPLYDTLHMLPISTAILVRPPVEVVHPLPTILHIHLLHTWKSPNSSFSISDNSMLREITRNFYELSVLGGFMFNLQEHPILPLHLEALEIMHDALRQGDIEQG